MQDEQNVREVLEGVFKVIHPEPTVESGVWWPWSIMAERFRRFLDAEAYLDAAMMLVPEGYDWSMDNFDGELGKPSAWLCNHGPFFNGTGGHPAIALARAAIAAIGGKHD